MTGRVGRNGIVSLVAAFALVLLSAMPASAASQPVGYLSCASIPDHYVYIYSTTTQHTEHLHQTSSGTKVYQFSVGAMYQNHASTWLKGIETDGVVGSDGTISHAGHGCDIPGQSY